MSVSDIRATHESRTKRQTRKSTRDLWAPGRAPTLFFAQRIEVSSNTAVGDWHHVDGHVRPSLRPPSVRCPTRLLEYGGMGSGCIVCQGPTRFRYLLTTHRTFMRVTLAG